MSLGGMGGVIPGREGVEVGVGVGAPGPVGIGRDHRWVVGRWDCRVGRGCIDKRVWGMGEWGKRYHIISSLPTAGASWRLLIFSFVSFFVGFLGTNVLVL